MKIAKLLAVLGITTACFLGISSVAHANVAGHVQFISGNVQITDQAGQIRPAQKGDAINEGDTLTSAQKSSAQIKMQDGGLVAVRPDTKLKFDEFVFAGKEDGSEKSFFSLFKGGLRAVTGLIGRLNKQNYRITTPAATIGIRGTDHETFLVTPGSPLAQVAPPGVYNKVNIGETYVATEKGTIFVQPNQMGFAGGMEQMPKVQPINTKLFTVAEASAPEAKAGKKEEKKEEKTEARKEEKVAKSDKEEKKEEKAEDSKQAGGAGAATAEGGSTGEATQGTATATAPKEETVVASVRETAVVDTTAPSTGGAPAATAPTVTTTTTVVAAPTPPTPTTVINTAPVTGGSTANLTTGTVATSAGQTVSATDATTAANAVATTAANAVATTAANAVGPLAPYVATNTSVAYGGSFNFIAAPGDLTWATNGPTTFNERWDDGSGSRSDTLNGASTTTTPTTTANGITYGVWENVTSVASSEQHRIELGYSGGSSGMLPVYMYGEEGYLDAAYWEEGDYWNGPSVTGAMANTFSYTAQAKTSFESDTWATGSVTAATMSADFTAQTVNVALAGTMGTNDWALTSGAMPIWFQNSANGAGAQFYDYSPTLTLNSASCSTCDGHIGGVFVGQNYTGAIVQYGFYNNAPVQGMNAGGLVAFSQDSPVTPGTPAPTGAYVVGDTWWVGSQAAITTDGAGVLTGWGWSDPDYGYSYSVDPAAGSVAQTAVGSGSGEINWGTWAAGSVGTSTSTFSNNPGPGQFHWITAPEPTPVYLAEVLTTTNAVYNLVGGDVTSQAGQTGGVHGTVSSASITANFTTQTVAASLAAAVNGHDWTASTTNAPLHYLNNNSMTGFSADSYRSSTDPRYLTVTVDGAAANGNLSGQLVGAALDGAFIKFNLDGQVTTPTPGYELVQGVAALGAAVANDPATPYRMVGISMSDPMVPVPTVMVDGAYNNAARVITDGSGNLTQFDDNSGGGSGGSGVAIQHVSGAFLDQGSVTIGSDTISWGRWDAGTVATVTDRATGSSQNMTLAGGAHTVVGPLMTGPVALPVSGSYTYTKVGNTLPTDGAGVAGTLNSATLSANFTAQTVDVGVNVTAGGATLNAEATSVPIQNRATFFTHSWMTGPGALAVTCTAGTCGTTNHGAIGGGFGGAGGAAAVITYGFEKQGANAGTVSGVAVFQR